MKFLKDAEWEDKKVKTKSYQCGVKKAYICIKFWSRSKLNTTFDCEYHVEHIVNLILYSSQNL